MPRRSSATTEKPAFLHHVGVRAVDCAGLPDAARMAGGRSVAVRRSRPLVHAHHPRAGPAGRRACQSGESTRRPARCRRHRGRKSGAGDLRPETGPQPSRLARRVARRRPASGRAFPARPHHRARPRCTAWRTKVPERTCCRAGVGFDIAGRPSTAWLAKRARRRTQCRAASAAELLPGPHGQTPSPQWHVPDIEGPRRARLLSSRRSASHEPQAGVGGRTTVSTARSPKAGVSDPTGSPFARLSLKPTQRPPSCHRWALSPGTAAAANLRV